MGINSEKHSPISRRKSIRKRNLSEAGRLSTSRLHFLQSNLVTRYLHTDLHDADERKIPDRILFLSLSAPASYKKHILLLIPLIFSLHKDFLFFHDTCCGINKKQKILKIFCLFSPLS